MIFVSLDWNGKVVRVPAMKHQGRLWFHWQGETFAVDFTHQQRRGGASKSKAQPGVLVAPMPGKITKTGVKQGQTVQAGQPLIVMEAMKMEYTLEADRAGRVLELNVETGQQVSLGQVLLRVGDE